MCRQPLTAPTSARCATPQMCTAVAGRSCSESSAKVRQNVWVNIESYFFVFFSLSCSFCVSCKTPLLLILLVFVRVSTQLLFNSEFGISFFLDSLSEISILAAAVGSACGILLLLLGIYVAVRYCRRKHMDNDIELQSQERKDNTMW